MQDDDVHSELIVLKDKECEFLTISKTSQILGDELRRGESYFLYGEHLSDEVNNEAGRFWNSLALCCYEDNGGNRIPRPHLHYSDSLGLTT